MLLSIRHVTSYSYDRPVVIGPHRLRLTPRADGCGPMLERVLSVTPQPSHLSVSVETDGSLSHWAWFKGETTRFTVESRVTIGLLEQKNPFDYLIHPPGCLSLPMVYPSQTFKELRAFLMADDIGLKVRDFAFDVLDDAKGRTVDFLVLLCQIMKRDFVYEFRHSGDPFQPEDTLASRRGSCRDWAVLYMAAARSVGLAARFVSGYFFDEKPSSPELHAWVEVYVPGGGWRGFDPSLGLACYEHHIPLASGASACAAAPIQGTFKGAAQAEMKLELEYQYSSMPVG